MPRGELSVLATMFTRKELAQGETLCVQGEKATCVYAIASGEIEVWQDGEVAPVARVRRGETLGLVGESGSGKSSVARLVMRLIEPDAGTVDFGGEDFLKLRGQHLRAMRRKVQIVFQDPFAALDWYMTHLNAPVRAGFTMPSAASTWHTLAPAFAAATVAAPV